MAVFPRCGGGSRDGELGPPTRSEMVGRHAIGLAHDQVIPTSAATAQLAFFGLTGLTLVTDLHFRRLGLSQQKILPANLSHKVRQPESLVTAINLHSCTFVALSFSLSACYLGYISSPCIQQFLPQKTSPLYFSLSARLDIGKPSEINY